MWNKPLKKLLENVPMGYAYHKIIANTSEGKVDYEFLKFNPLFQRIMGLEKSDLEKNKGSDIPPEKRDHTIYRSDIFKKIALQGGYETYNCFSNQLDRWFKVHVFSPQEGFFMTLLVDISQEKEQLKQFESFFNINLDLLCIADSEGRFVKLNKEWERLLGYQIDELEGRFFLDFVHPQDIQKTKEAMEKLNHKDDVLNFSNRYLTKNGDYKIIEWRSHPHGHFIFAAARDITTSRTKERELTAILETTI